MTRKRGQPRRTAWLLSPRKDPSSARVFLDEETIPFLPDEEVVRTAPTAFDAGCAGKVRYGSEAAALAGLTAHHARRSAYAPYVCTFCHHWHLGSRKPKGAR